MIRAYLVLGVVVMFGAYTVYQRHDAVQDAINASEVDNLNSRIETSIEAKERRREIESLERCTRIRNGIIRLSGPDTTTAADAAFHRCRATAAVGETGDGRIPGPQ